MGNVKEYWTTRDVIEEATRRGRPVTQRYLQRLCLEGKIAAQRFGRDYLIPDEIAQRWLTAWASAAR